ncbi:hypothetical protein P7K49_022893 [Saguinus oedipus]|uniref:Uncharacterized protein n=1 Tax=Saguinus oedipus TaxID=9490 RepID=A0ABQ9UK25_SAGOE|nr:hypothetical protein P7K49_022893 [Saguinus oedipus]
MPQPPNMMGAHTNNMMAQAPAQSQFLPQSQFPSSSGAMSVNSVGMGQPPAQTGVSQLSLENVKEHCEHVTELEAYRLGQCATVRNVHFIEECTLQVNFHKQNILKKPTQLIKKGQVPGAALPNPLNMLGPQASQLPCPPVTQSPLHPTPPPASTAAGMPSLQHPTPPGMTPPQPAAPTQPSTPVSSSGQTPTPTPGSVPSATQTQSTPTVQTAAQSQVTPQPQTPVQPPSVATPQSSQQQPTPVHAQPPGTPLSQAAASIDNRVPTPSSVASAETNSQQPGPDVPVLEMKAEAHTEDTEPDPGESKGEPRSEMMEEDLQGASQVKEETDTTEQKSEPMEVDEKKPEVKVEVKEEEESNTNGIASQSTSPSQPRKKKALRLSTPSPVPTGLVVGVSDELWLQGHAGCSAVF